MFSIYILSIQPNYGYIASRNMKLLLILICKNKLCLDGTYLHYTCDTLNTTGMNYLNIIIYMNIKIEV